MEISWLAVFCLLNIAGLRIGGASNASQNLANPELLSKSPIIMKGNTVTLRCIFRNASLPVTFTLFHNIQTKGRRTLQKDRAAFNITVSDLSDLGPYKCKANNSATNGMYSKVLNFTLQELTTQGPGPADRTGRGWTHWVWIIPLLVLAIVAAAVVFWRISKHAAKQEATQDNNTYENVPAGAAERCRDREEGNVEYCTVILKEGGRADEIRAEETTEYTDIAQTRLQVQQQP